MRGMDTNTTINMTPLSKCVGCGRTAGRLDEYHELAEFSGYVTAEDAVRNAEGTFNPANGRFYCSPCYVDAGQPLGVAP